MGKITEKTSFEGYTNKKETEKKILRNTFEAGDKWFNTGDMMKTVDVGFSLGLPHFQFVDRVGDTFRWKSENVSTNEVGEIINAHAQIDFCNVYGVEITNADGRAGMASLVLAEGIKTLDLESFSTYVNAHLPSYARPVFLRVQNELDTTGTFKMVKGELRKEGYDLDQVKDPLFVLKPRSALYEASDGRFCSHIEGRRRRLLSIVLRIFCSHSLDRSIPEASGVIVCGPELLTDFMPVAVSLAPNACC